MPIRNKNGNSITVVNVIKNGTSVPISRVDVVKGGQTTTVFNTFLTPNFVTPNFPNFVAPNFTTVPDFTITPSFPNFVSPTFPDFVGGCLDINTPIHMYDGTTKALKDVEAGDELKGYYIPGMIYEDQPGWEEWTESVEVAGYFKKTIVQSAVFDTYYAYYVINNDIHVTKRHPFLTNKKDTNIWSWVDAPYLQIGDNLKGLNDEIIEVTSIVYVPETIYVKTLDVEDLDNYIAGHTGVVVHNDLVKA